MTATINIGMLGAGKVGAALARAFVTAGHAVKLANSRGPESIRDLAASIGATATLAADAVRNVDAIVVSVNPPSYASVRPLLVAVPEHVPIIDTGNYHPLRDGQIQTLDDGQIEALWISEQLDRPVTKAWNTALVQTMTEKAAPAESPGRLALPIAGDDPEARRLAATLTDDSGFDPLDIGDLDNSWRAQPGNPAYCTELPLEALKTALERADARHAPTRRDLANKVFWTFEDDIGREDIVRVYRAISRTPDPT